jgi:hypothetical protein
MFLRQIPDHALAQYAYLIGCQRTGEALIVDPERDVDRYLKVLAGAALAKRLPVARLRQGFAVMVIATGAFVLWQNGVG